MGIARGSTRHERHCTMWTTCTHVFDGDAVLERLEALGVELVDELVGDAESAVSRLVVLVRLSVKHSTDDYMSATCHLHVRYMY